MATYVINKILSCFDDKIFVLNDGIHMPAYFIKTQIHTNDRNSKMLSHKKKRFSQIKKNI